MQFPSRGWGDPLGVDAWDGVVGGGGLGVVERTKEPPWLEKKRAVEFTLVGFSVILKNSNFVQGVK